jgi:hypothetical protein
MSYVGVPPFGQTVRTVTEVVAQQDQSVFYPTGGYIPGYLDVELDGSDLGSQDFTATDGLSVVLTQKCGAGDLFRTKAYWPVAMADTMRRAEINGIVGAGGWAMRNRLINGDMRIDQRNAGGSITPSNSWIYGVDRWAFFSHVSNKYSVVKSSDAPAGFPSSILITSLSAYTPAANEFCGFKQAIEGYNVADLDFGLATAKTVTLSFWVKSSVTGSFGVTFYNAGGARSFPASYTINAANTWEKKVITIAGDTAGTWLKDNGEGLVIDWVLGAGSGFNNTSTSAWANGWNHLSSNANLLATNGATLRISGVQFEAGSYATPFDFRPIGTELALCQRYYEKSFDDGVAPADGATGDRRMGPGGVYNGTNWDGPNISFKVNKRAAPTVTFYRPSFATGVGTWALYENGAAWVSRTMTASGLSITGFIPGGTVSSGSNGQAVMCSGQWAASAEL